MSAERLSWLGDAVAAITPFIPPSLGALVGLGYARNQTPMQKLVSFGTGAATGIFIGAALAEVFTLGPRATIGVGFLLGMMGYDLMLGLTAAARNFAADPLQSFKAWWGAWWNRGQG